MTQSQCDCEDSQPSRSLWSQELESKTTGLLVVCPLIQDSSSQVDGLMVKETVYVMLEEVTAEEED